MVQGFRAEVLMTFVQEQMKHLEDRLKMDLVPELKNYLLVCLCLGFRV